MAACAALATFLSGNLDNCDTCSHAAPLGKTEEFLHKEKYLTSPSTPEQVVAQTIALIGKGMECEPEGPVLCITHNWQGKELAEEAVAVEAHSCIPRATNLKARFAHSRESIHLLFETPHYQNPKQLPNVTGK